MKRKRPIINFIRYRNFIKINKELLNKEFDLKIDNIYRLGCKISISNEKYELLRNYKNAELDVHKNLDEELRKYIHKLDKFLIKNNMFEYIGMYSADRTDYNEVTLILSYKLMNIVKFSNIIRLILLFSFISMFLVFFNIYLIIPGFIIFLFCIITNFILFKKLLV
jgi:hypothetical protein